MSRGALIVALIDALESSAFSVELTMVFHGNCGGADTMQTILAKRAANRSRLTGWHFALPTRRCFAA